MFYYLCRLVCTLTSLLYPLYASYKALRPPASVGATPQEQHAQLERWCMFWCVLAVVGVWEEWAEWSVRWFPFYQEVKTLVILWLALPQIEGSTYIYLNHLSPLLTSHEHDIDAALSNARTSATRIGLDYLNAGIRRARSALLGTLAAAPTADEPAPAAVEPLQQAQPPYTGGAHSQAHHASRGLAGLAGGLLRQYAPAAIAAGTALLNPVGAAAGAGAARGMGASSALADAGAGGEARRRRRAELEHELEALDRSASESDASSPSVGGSKAPSHPASLSPASPAGRADPVANRVAGESQLRSASSSFEEIRRDEASGFASAAAGARGARKSGGGSWFGWGGAADEGVGREKKDA